MIYTANPNAQFKSYKKIIEKSVYRVLNSKKYILGNEVKNLEKEFSRYIGTKFAIGVANGTDALELALKALNIGIGDEVITVAHTAVATVSAIRSVGADPVIVDINSDTYTIDCSQIKRNITKKTKAIIPVHIYGQSVEMDKIQKICKQNKIFLIEDVSQAHGAKFKKKKLGSFGDIACFSCYPTKNLGAIGDAGLITTNSNKYYSKIKMLREYGWAKKYISSIEGRNSRLDEIQASILRIKLKNLDQDNLKRIKIAEFYNKNLDKNKYSLPFVPKNNYHVFHLYVIKTNNRNKLLKYLKLNGVFAGIHYPKPIHLQKAYYKKIKTSSNLKNTEFICNKILSLPIYPELTMRKQRKIVSLLNKFE
jgi:dTDP-4-amino-4,6-dideoxygalactose transaminase